jgi:hypothetical protein
MLRNRLAALGICALLAAGKFGLGSAASIDAPELQGAWEITSVQRDGVADPTQVGSILTIAGNAATFQPKSIWLGAGPLHGDGSWKTHVIRVNEVKLKQAPAEAVRDGWG